MHALTVVFEDGLSLRFSNKANNGAFLQFKPCYRTNNFRWMMTKKRNMLFPRDDFTNVPLVAVPKKTSSRMHRVTMST